MSLLQTRTKATPGPKPFTPAQGGLLRCKCPCGGSPGLDGECEECSGKRLTLQRSFINRAHPIKLLRSLAEPLNPDPGGTGEPGFGHDFSGVRMHTHVPERMQSKLNGNEPGDQYEQEADRIAKQVMMSVPPNKEPSVHQLSSSPSIMQRALGGEAAQTSKLAPTEVVPETETTAKIPSANLIVDDEASELGPGQMRKREFLDEVQRAVCAAADAELAAVGRSTAGCPYLERWMGYYRMRDSQQVERTVRRYAPETIGVTTARDYIPPISTRVRRAVAVWATTGQITGVPEGVSPAMPSAGPETGGSEGGKTTRAAASDVQFKDGAGGGRSADNPAAVRARLDGGRPLDSIVRSRMESAFGHDFSRVRIHTDSKAAGITSGLRARAFTIGSDVAFALGEYQPGTLIGDALIAHELAHVVQQGGGSDSIGPMQTGDANYNTLEGDADESAISAVVSLWRGAKGATAKIARNAMPSLKSGLRLQRCTVPGPLVVVASPESFQFKKVSGNWKVACFEQTFYGQGWSIDCSVEIGVPLENHLGPVSDSLAQQEAYLSNTLATHAVHEVPSLQPVRPPSVTFCNAYQAAMQRALEIAVPGAKVTKFTKYCK